MNNKTTAEITGPETNDDITAYLIINNIPYQVINNCYTIDLNDITSEQMHEILNIKR